MTEVEEFEFAAALEREKLASMQHVSAPSRRSAIDADLQQMGAALKKGGTDILRGFMGGVGAQIEGMGALNPRPTFSKKGVGIDNPAIGAAADLRGKVPPGDDSWLTTGLEGVGGMAATLGGFLQTPGTAAASGFLGNIAGRAGGELAGKVDPRLQVPGALLGGLVGGAAPIMATSRLTGLSQSRPHQTLREEAPQTGWDEAQRNLGLFSSHGMAGKSTLPEAFPGNTRLKSLADEARGQTGGERLTSITETRSRDLAGLTEAVKKKVFGDPRTSISDTANDAVGAAASRLDQLRKQRTDQYSATIAKAESLPESGVAMLYDALKSAGKATQSKVEKDAYDAVAATLIQPNKASKLLPQPDSIDKTRSGFKVTKANPPVEVEVPKLKTDVQAAAKDLKQLQTELEVSDNALGGVKLNAGAVRKAYNLVNDVLKGLSPTFAKAERDYQEFSRGIMEPATSGVLGKLAGRNPDPNTPTPPTRLNAVVEKQDPADVSKTLQELTTGAAESGPSDIAKRVAQAVFNQKLEKGSTNLGQTLRGAPGSAASGQVKALVEGGGGSVNALDEGMKVSELLQGMQGPPGTANILRPTLLGALATPFSSSRIAITQAGRKNDYTEIARLLSQSTPEALAELQRIAMFDPNIRKILSTAAMVNPAMQQQSKER